MKPLCQKEDNINKDARMNKILKKLFSLFGLIKVKIFYRRHISFRGNIFVLGIPELYFKNGGRYLAKA